MPNTSQLQICWGLGKPVTVEEIQVDPPKANEVRVKMLCASLCHTDISSTKGFPHINTSRMSIKGQKLYHIFSSATWSEYMVTDANYLLKVDPSINLAHASFISCGFSTGFGAAWKEAKVESGSSVAVFGLGAVGLGAISGAKMMGATKIIGIDKNEMKREKGEAFGMTDFINPSDSAKSASELVKELSGGMGVDYSIECTGVPSLLTESVEATKIGKTIAVGIGAETVVQFDLLALLLVEL
ncbi:hypothetical protein SESBI_23018 [Sesbania bispinosa]|nr:hypothetical protein SESBI_23018 [Sesbania bispinosa]